MVSLIPEKSFFLNFEEKKSMDSVFSSVPELHLNNVSADIKLVDLVFINEVYIKI